MMPCQFYQVNSITRINQLQEYAGPWRVAAGQDTYGSDSESDNSGEEVKHRFAYGNTTIERMKLHKMAVEAIAVIRQFDYENGHPPFEVC